LNGYNHYKRMFTFTAVTPWHACRRGRCCCCWPSASQLF